MERFTCPGADFDGHYAVAAKELEAISPGVANYSDAKYWLAIALRGGGRALEAESTVDSLLAGRPNDERALEVKSGLASDRNDWIPQSARRPSLAKLRPDSACGAMSFGRPPFTIKKCGRRGRTLTQGLCSSTLMLSCVIEILANYIERRAATPKRLRNWNGWFDFFPRPTQDVCVPGPGL